MAINEKRSKLRKTQNGAGAPVPPAERGANDLARLRLLVAFDALLATRSVSGAAKELGLSAAAVSRMLGQLRVMFDDELMIRAGRGLAPTPRAEALRPRLRALAAEAGAIMAAPEDALPGMTAPPLSINPEPPLEGEPSEFQIQLRKQPLGPSAPARARLARYVSTIGAGRSRIRPLTGAEAEDAFAILFDGAAHDIQIGALLVALQVRGLTPQELAGMVRAARRGMPPLGLSRGAADLDWPAYVSPRNQRPRLFLLAARLIADAGYRVLLHGFDRPGPAHRPTLARLGIPVAASPEEAEALFGAETCVFLPLSAMRPQMAALMRLYRLFEMRSPLSHGLLFLNPLAAPATLTGLPGAATARLHGEAAGLLGFHRLLYLDSHRDAAQATPHRMMTLSLSAEGETRGLVVPSSGAARPEKLPPDLTAPEYALALWNGAIRDAAATAAILDTAALALIAMGEAPADMNAARRIAGDMWSERRRRHAH